VKVEITEGQGVRMLLFVCYFKRFFRVSDVCNFYHFL